MPKSQARSLEDAIADALAVWLFALVASIKRTMRQRGWF